jgi:hypothetical protein
MVRCRPFLLSIVCLWSLVPAAGFADGPDAGRRRDANEEGQQPFQKTVFVTSLNTPTAVFTVPRKKRLVIEFFSAEAFVSPGETVNRFFISTQNPALPPGNVDFTHFVGPSSHGPSFGQEVFLASQSLRMYVKAGDELVLSATGDGTGGAFLSVSGYLLDVR